MGSKEHIRQSTWSTKLPRATLFTAISGLIVMQPSLVLAQPRGSMQEFARANRVAEALRQVTLQGNTRNPGYYSDWQVKGDRIPLWSRQCIGRRLTPQQFEADQSAAASIVTCIVQDMMRQEIRSSRNDERVAIRRVAAWWVTGDPARYNDNGIAPYTQRVLTTYRPNGTLTAARPAPPKPIKIGAITSSGPAQPSRPTQPVLAKPVQVKPKPVSVPTETLPSVKPRPAALAPQAQPTAKPVVQPSPQPTAKPTSPNTPLAIKPTGTNFYDRYMQAGYVASRAKDYQTALLFFQRALDERPNDSYATTAITNMEGAIKAASQP